MYKKIYMLPKKLIQKLKAEAEKREVSEAEILRNILFEYFSKHEEKIGE